MEIVSEPDLRSADEAREYLVQLRQILRYIGVSKANMEEGNFRCDANISLRPAARHGVRRQGGSEEHEQLPRRRRMPSRFEIERQTRELEPAAASPRRPAAGSRARRTVSQRSKEQAHDYRYFPEPDLPPVTLTTA